MRKKTFLLVALVLWTAVSMCTAAPQFATQRLETLAARLPEIPFGDLTAGTENVFSLHDHPVVVRTNKWGDVEHIGFRLFSQQIRDEQPSVVYDFLERYFLELALAGQEEAGLRLNVDMVTITPGDIEDIFTLDGTESIEISLIIFRGYHVSWYREDIEVLGISFPMDYQLLAGCNSIELEDNFLRDIHRYKPVDRTFAPLVLPDDSLYGSYYVSEGRSYVSEVIRNDRFYVREGGGWKLLCSGVKPYWSSCNIATSSEPVGDFMLEAKLDKYGYTEESFSLPLHQWLQWCEEEGGTPYFGIRSKDSEYVTGTIIIPYEEKGFCHMMSVKIPVKAIENGKGTVTGRLYIYIPLHNIAQSYFEFKKISRKVKKI